MTLRAMRMRGALAFLLAYAALLAPARAEIVNVGNDELRRLIDRGVAVVDIRTAPEWAETGVLAGSHLITFFDEKGRYDAAAWLARVRSIAGPESPIVVICRSGNRTIPVSRFLDRQAGYRTVYNVRAGIRDWIRAGFPVRKIEEKEL